MNILSAVALLLVKQHGEWKIQYLIDTDRIVMKLN